jgi:hypothetical protein
MGVWRNTSDHELVWHPDGPAKPAEIVKKGEIVKVADDFDYAVESLLGVDNMTRVADDELEQAMAALEEKRQREAEEAAGKAEAGAEGGQVSSQPAGKKK